MCCSQTSAWKHGLPLGDSGKTFRAMHETEGTLVAGKTVYVVDERSAGLVEELGKLKESNHPNLISLLDFAYFPNENQLTMYMELAPFGSLPHFLQSNGWPFQDLDWQGTLAGMLDGLQHLHRRGVSKGMPGAHGDVRGANVMLAQDMTPKWSNYWLSGPTTVTTDVAPVMPSMRWKAPELLRSKDEKPSVESDVWGFGCTIIELFSGENPWSNISLQGVWDMLQDDDAILPMPASVPFPLRRLVRRCLHRRPSRRPSIPQLARDPSICFKAEMSDTTDEYSSNSDTSFVSDAQPEQKPDSANDGQANHEPSHDGSSNGCTKRRIDSDGPADQEADLPRQPLHRQISEECSQDILSIEFLSQSGQSHRRDCCRPRGQNRRGRHQSKPPRASSLTISSSAASPPLCRHKSPKQASGISLGRCAASRKVFEDARQSNAQVRFGMQLLSQNTDATPNRDIGPGRLHLPALSQLQTTLSSAHAFVW